MHLLTPVSPAMHNAAMELIINYVIVLINMDIRVFAHRKMPADQGMPALAPDNVRYPVLEVVNCRILSQLLWPLEHIANCIDKTGLDKSLKYKYAKNGINLTFTVVCCRL